MKNNPYTSPNSTVVESDAPTDFDGFTYEKGSDYALVRDHSKLGHVCIECRKMEDLAELENKLRYVSRGTLGFLGLSFLFPILFPFAILNLIYRSLIKPTLITVKFYKCRACIEKFKRNTIRGLTAFAIAILILTIALEYKGMILVFGFLLCLFMGITFFMSRGKSLRILSKAPINGQYRLGGFNYILGD